MLHTSCVKKLSAMYDASKKSDCNPRVMRTRRSALAMFSRYGLSECLCCLVPQIWKIGPVFCVEGEYSRECESNAGFDRPADRYYADQNVPVLRSTVSNPAFSVIFIMLALRYVAGYNSIKALRRRLRAFVRRRNYSDDTTYESLLLPSVGLAHSNWHSRDHL